MRTRAIAVVVTVGVLVAGACSDGNGSVLSSATTTTPDDPSTTTTDDDELTEPSTGEDSDACSDPPIWAFKRMDDPPAVTDEPSDDTEDPSDDVDDGSDDRSDDVDDGSDDPSDDVDDPSEDSDEPDEDCDEPQPQPEPELGTGDVQITLRWESDADLDLHVTEPDGTEIWFGDTGPTATGGQLDVDSNIGCENDGSVENVFWAEGDMPLGEYQVEIVGYTVDGCGGGDYTVTAQVEGAEILNEDGSVAEDEEDPYTFEVS
ncbi:MAG: hypothetical protein ACRD2C_01600 [Acidimicrobiales bacterium]